MNDEWNKGHFLIGPQRSPEARQGQFAREQEHRREGAAAQTARERDQRFQDQMIREAIWSASRPAGIDEGRIFSGPSRSKSRRGASGKAGLAIAALVVLFVFFSVNGDRTTATRAVPTQHGRAPPTANPQSEPTPVDALNAPATPVAARWLAAPPMPPLDRFALRRLELVQGDNLDLVVAWQLPDGARRAAAMDAFLVTRDAARQRTPLLERWSVFPGESTIPLALPSGLLPGKYELETIWTLGGEAREVRTPFTLVQHAVVSGVGSIALTPSSPPASAQAAVATHVSPTPAAIEPTPTPAAELPPSAERVPPAPPLPPAVRPRTPANDQLYTGG